MNHLSFRQFTIGVCILAALMIYFTFKSFCQVDKKHSDTIYVKEIKVPYNGLVDKKGRVVKVWYRVIKVDSGYIIKNEDSYVINGKKIKAKLFKLYHTPYF